MDWDEAIHLAAMVLNTMPLAGTSVSPFELVFGFKPRTPAGAMLEVGQGQTRQELSKAEYVKHVFTRWAEMEKIVTNARLQQTRRNQHKACEGEYEYKFNKQDLVLINRPNIKKGTTRKLLYQATGPFEVMREKHKYVYELKRLSTGKMTTCNVSDMSPFITKEHYETRLDESTLANGPTEDPGPEELCPKSGDYLLFPGTTSHTENWDTHPERFPFYLCKVINYDKHNGTVRIQYF